jgi:hypothetical protein
MHYPFIAQENSTVSCKSDALKHTRLSRSDVDRRAHVYKADTVSLVSKNSSTRMSISAPLLAS